MMDRELIDQLSKGGFLIDDDEDELALLRHEMHASRYSSNSLTLTIAPTSACNFGCVYCYEKDSLDNQYMSEKTQEAVIELIKARISLINFLSITWYGGEPLLALDIIERMSEKILALIDEKNITYSATIVTNGYLLDRNVAERLKKARISSCQVTIDGLPSTHNLRRPLKGGQPTFNTIMQNLKTVAGVMSPIALRVNMDKNNTDAMDQIFSYLLNHDLINSVVPYPAAVTNSNSCYQQEICLQAQEFSALELDYIKKASHHRKNGEAMLLSKFPARIKNYCRADMASTMVINSDGSLYKCWCDIGRADVCFGNINDKKRYCMKETVYMRVDPTENTKCMECSLLPVCMGGCPHQYACGDQDRCVAFKYQMEQYLPLICKSILEKRKAAETCG